MPEFVLEGVTAAFYKLDTFTQGYIEALFFAETPEDEQWGFCDLSPDCLEQIKLDCAHYQSDERVQELIAGHESRAGADLLFSRNGHGCGFWDGDWDKIDPEGVLQQRAELFQNVDFYSGDDGLIYSA